MKIRTELCNGYNNLEKFLNEEIDYKGFRPEYIILGITQDKEIYTVIYKDYNSK